MSPQVTSILPYHLKTGLLFIASDVKYTVIPVALFAHMASARPLTSRDSFLGTSWLVYHLFMFNACNQRGSYVEDSVNKPWRPIPSGRITPSTAKILSIWLYISSIAGSIYLRVPWASIMLCFFTYLYNQLKMDNHWASKSLLNAAGYGCFEIGTTVLTSGGVATSSMYNAIFLSVMVLLTTIHIQDIPDEIGDRIIGRQTAIICWGQLYTRLSVAGALVMWFALLVYKTRLSFIFILAYGLATMMICARLFLLRGQANDERTFTLYYIWLSAAHIFIVN